MSWSPASWRAFPARHQPDYQDQGLLAEVLDKIAELPPLVTPDEVQTLKAQLARVFAGEAFVLQGGDCAESFSECTAEKVLAQAQVLTRMGRILAQAQCKPTIKIGRIAGQYAKPRSAASELVDGRIVPPFLGESVNGPRGAERAPDPLRLLTARFHAASTLNHLRAVADREIFTSHEGLLLASEERQTRFVARLGAWYNLSAHFLWIGERTRALTGAHVEYFRGIANPVGVKVGPGADPREIAALVRALDPAGTPGKVTLITRFGRGRRAALRALVGAVRDEGLPVLWQSDPMHGNTTVTRAGLKTRAVEDVTAEIEDAWAVHGELGRRLDGLHLELSGESVTECTGGSERLTEADLPLNYKSPCDPRLSHGQALDVARFLAGLARGDWRASFDNECQSH